MNNDHAPVRDATNEQSASCMLNHFAFVGVISITSAFVVAVLLSRLFLRHIFKKRPRGNVASTMFRKCLKRKHCKSNVSTMKNVIDSLIQRNEIIVR